MAVNELISAGCYDDIDPRVSRIRFSQNSLRLNTSPRVFSFTGLSGVRLSRKSIIHKMGEDKCMMSSFRDFLVFGANDTSRNMPFGGIWTLGVSDINGALYDVFIGANGGARYLGINKVPTSGDLLFSRYCYLGVSDSALRM